MDNKPIYIHYGSKTFDKDKIYLPKMPPHNKPMIGLWACRTDATLSWKDFCEREDFGVCSEDNSFKFTLSDKAKILEIHCVDDIANYIKPYIISDSISIPTMQKIDFDKIMEDEYDGIELFLSEDYFNLHFGIFYGWDADSIVVWNANVIETL